MMIQYILKAKKKSETNLVANFQDKGTVTVKIRVDGVVKSTKQLNLNNENTVTFE